MARDLTFQIKGVEELYYLCSKNKGTFQLHGNWAADLHHCLYAKTGFLMTWLIWYESCFMKFLCVNLINVFKRIKHKLFYVEFMTYLPKLILVT